MKMSPLLNEAPHSMRWVVGFKPRWLYRWEKNFITHWIEGWWVNIKV